MAGCFSMLAKHWNSFLLLKSLLRLFLENIILAGKGPFADHSSGQTTSSTTYNHHLKPPQTPPLLLASTQNHPCIFANQPGFFGTFRLLLLFKTQHHTLSATPRCRGQVFTGLRVLFWAVVLFGGCMYLLGVVTRTLELRTEFPKPKWSEGSIYRFFSPCSCWTLWER